MSDIETVEKSTGGGAWRGWLRGAGAVLAVLAGNTAAQAQTQPYVPYMTPGPFAYTRLNPQPYVPPSANIPIDNVIVCKPVPTAGQFAGPYPAMLMIHGGSYMKDDATIDSGRWCRGLASWGFIAFSINFRQEVSTDQSTWWPTQLIDAQAAVRWMRTYAKSLNINPSYIGALGDSSGAQIAQMLGFVNKNVPGDIAGLYPTSSPQVQYVISEFGPVASSPPAYIRPNSITPYGLVQAQADITNNLNGNPPIPLANTMLVAAKTDTVVAPPKEMQKLFCLLKKYHYPAQYITFNGGHEFSGIPMTSFNDLAGGIQLQATSFADAYLHGRNPAPIPTNFPGPGKPFNDVPLPTCPP